MKLEINQVSKQFKDKTAVDQFSMMLKAGECIGLIGPNGAGKTTLLKMIVDIMDPSRGDIQFNGKTNAEMKREMGYLPQHPDFYPWMTAHETLLFMGKLSGVTQAEMTKAIPDIMAKVGLSGEEDTKISTFSGGMKQRLGIAQALLHQPSLLIMDEPVSSLDPIGRREVLHILEEIKQNTTILLSTHILSDVEELCERFVIIKDGKKMEDTSIATFLTKHSENKVHVVAGNTCEDWLKVLERLDYVKEVDVSGNQMTIKVAEMQRDKHRLLESALNHNVDLLKFEIAGETLEELFLEMVVEK